MLFSGGRYLFDTAEHAREYRDWVFNNYVLDGVLFLKRSYFLNPECHAWTVIGAHDFGDIHSSQIVLRTERWSLPNARQPAWVLEQKFDAILAAAQARGLTSVWLLYDPEEALASLVYFAGRAGPSDPRMPDLASLSVLADAPRLGEIFDDQGWKRTFDRTQWVLTIWFPFALGDRGEPAFWPNTPPFVLPYRERRGVRGQPRRKRPQRPARLSAQMWRRRRPKRRDLNELPGRRAPVSIRVGSQTT